MKTILSKRLILSLFIVVATTVYFLLEPSSNYKIISADSIITMNPEQPRVEAAVIQSGKILATGDLISLKQQWADAEHLHFPEKTLAPGFIENHLHPAMAALLLPFEWITPFEWSLPGKQVTSTQGEINYRAALKASFTDWRAQQTSDDDWFITWGYHHLFHGEMSRALLDQLFPDKPVIVWHRSFHEIWANSKALELAAITEEDLASHHHADFETGHFFETGLEVALTRFGRHVIKPGRMMDGLNQVTDIVHRGGITTIADMAAGMFDMTVEWWLFRWFFDDSDTPFRTRLIPLVERLAEEADSEEAIQHSQLLLEKGNDQLQYVKQVKLLADGAFYSQLMQMRAPGYHDGHSGQWITPPDQLEKVASRFWQADYQLHIHTNGDLGAEVVINMIEKLQQKYPREDHRTTLHHLGYIGPDQAEKIADNGITVSANPYYLYTLGEVYAEQGLGEERAHTIFRGRDLLDAGIKLSLHSDFCMAPAQPLRLASVAVNRKGAGGLQMAKDQRLSVHEALQAITIDAAYAIQMENEVGSIEEGKLADFVILDQDPYTVDPTLLQDIPIWGTIFQGRLFPVSER
ncbi:amidohydrolase [Endozoicomonas ascidiicola]|uniref:amidohydrolase n=1 Tax=Endozoicomonas ascidiicola TaxID=1698521 RepID=UPI00083166CE|nr:amidohydrolase [Endozoicomonas ascidiicola]